MASGKFVSYYRVSTQQQGRSGLGLEGQRHAVTEFLNGGSWELVSEFTEIESGKRSDRPQLQLALAAARRHRAVLLIAKLDRLSRDAHFLLGLEKAGVEFVCADMPNANRLTIGIMAMVADEERRMISARTKAALAAARARGVVLGNPRLAECRNVDTLAARAAKASARASMDADLCQIVVDSCACGETSIRAIGDWLTTANVPTATGKAEWSFGAVRRLLVRLEATAVT
ncbi:MAG: recombinase family protein [Phaeospirillum sp.]|nr:recombinase family protein [Phaeospirillum sp.]